MKKDKSLILPRVYLDTNILISAILESDPSWQAGRSLSCKKKANITTSKEVFDRWESKNLKTSTYAIAELISKGRTKEFSKSYEQMMVLVSKTVLPRCEVLHSTIKETTIPKLDKQYGERWRLAHILVEGEVVGENGSPKGSGYFEVILQTIGNLVTSWGGAFGLEGKGSIKDVNRIEYSAPAFEIMLFSKAAEIAINYKINLPDAIHLMYAKPSDIDIIISNDENFKSDWDKVPKELKRHIELMTSEQVLSKHRRELEL